MALTNELVTVDIETGGLNPFEHPLIEVGYVLDPEDVRVTFSLPFDADLCEPRALEINGWDRQGARDSFPETLEPSKAAAMLLDNFAGRMVLASPATFDVPWLAYWLHTLGHAPSWSHRAPIDLKTYFQGHCRVLDDVSNSAIAAYLGMSGSAKAHTALADAVWTRDMFRALNPYGFPR